MSGVLRSIREIVATLEDRSGKDGDGRRRVEVGGLLTQVKAFKFIFVLVLLVKGLSITKGLSDQLQDDSLDLAAAGQLVDSVLSSLCSSRSDKEWERTWETSVDLAERLGIAVVDERCKGRKRNSQRQLSDMVVLETTGRREVVDDDSTEKNEEVTIKRYYRAHVYNPVIDSWVGELQRRFSEENREIMNSVQACCPRSGVNFLNPEKLLPLAARYNVEATVLLEEQCKQALHTLSGKELKGISDVLLHLNRNKKGFAIIVKLLTIALTLGVSTATCERSFSGLRRIKTYLRSSMSESRMNDLAILSIERDLSCDWLTPDLAIDKFAAVDKGRRIKLK